MVYGMGSILLDVECDMIRQFLYHVCRGCEQEASEIERKLQEGHFHELIVYERALDYVRMRYDLAIRTVYYEVSALIEHELQNCAFPAWQASKKFKGPKSLFEIADSPGRDIRSLKMVSDLRLSDTQKLIEDYCQIRLEALPGGQSIIKIREIVNSFKHRNGFEDFRKVGRQTIKFEQYRPTREDAYKAINSTETFVKALWTAMDRKEGIGTI